MQISSRQKQLQARASRVRETSVEAGRELAGVRQGRVHHGVTPSQVRCTPSLLQRDECEKARRRPIPWGFQSSPHDIRICWLLSKFPNPQMPLISSSSVSVQGLLSPLSLQKAGTPVTAAKYVSFKKEMGRKKKKRTSNALISNEIFKLVSGNKV